MIAEEEKSLGSRTVVRKMEWESKRSHLGP